MLPSFYTELFMQKKIFSAVLLLLPVLAPRLGAAQDPERGRALILQDSKLSIHGTSNVTDFICLYNYEIEQDTLTYAIQRVVEDSLVIITGDKLKLKTEGFDCGKKGINRDFRKTLKSEQYPLIEIELLKLFLNNHAPFKAEVLIRLAGNTQPYLVLFRDTDEVNRVHLVSGVQDLKMTDFGLDPPSALFGLVKVRDELKIHFTLKVKEL